MIHQCKKCLLLEAGEKQSHKTVTDYIDNLESSLKVTDYEYKRRLQLCRNCDNLISGMCLKCGCYVAIRAVLKSESCPDYNDVKWHKVD